MPLLEIVDKMTSKIRTIELGFNLAFPVFLRPAMNDPDKHP
jgi:hypothetical protein